jgi:hypothetical protein
MASGAGGWARTSTPLREGDFKTGKKRQQLNALLSCCLFSLRGLRIATVFYEGYGHPGGQRCLRAALTRRHRDRYSGESSARQSDRRRRRRRAADRAGMEGAGNGSSYHTSTSRTRCQWASAVVKCRMGDRRKDRPLARGVARRLATGCNCCRARWPCRLTKVST